MKVPELEVLEDGGEADFDIAQLKDAVAHGSTGQLTGQKALMLAVLEDGIRAYLSKTPQVAADASDWVKSNRRRSAFSFIVVCETLNLDPDAVRRALLRMREEGVDPRKIARSLPNVRGPGQVSVRRK